MLKFWLLSMSNWWHQIILVFIMIFTKNLQLKKGQFYSRISLVEAMRLFILLNLVLWVIVFFIFCVAKWEVFLLHTKVWCCLEQKYLCNWIESRISSFLMEDHFNFKRTGEINYGYSNFGRHFLEFIDSNKIWAFKVKN